MNQSLILTEDKKHAIFMVRILANYEKTLESLAADLPQDCIGADIVKTFDIAYDSPQTSALRIYPPRKARESIYNGGFIGNEDEF